MLDIIMISTYLIIDVLQDCCSSFQNIMSVMEISYVKIP